MDTIGQILSALGGLVALVCLIVVWVQMFKNGHVALGIICILLSFCCIGYLITFIYGWMKSGEWGIRNIMFAWTIALILQVVGGAVNPAPYRQLQELQKQLQQQ